MKMRGLIDLVVESTVSLVPVTWAIPKLLSNETVVWVDVAAIDSAWQRDRSLYVGPGGTNGIAPRYPRFGDWLNKGIPVRPAEGGPLEHAPQVWNFGNGRHRFAWLRDHGATAVPMVVRKAEADDITRRFGTDARNTVISCGNRLLGT